MGGWTNVSAGIRAVSPSPVRDEAQPLVVRVLPDDRQGIERGEGRRTAAIRPCSQCRAYPFHPLCAFI